MSAAIDLLEESESNSDSDNDDENIEQYADEKPTTSDAPTEPKKRKMKSVVSQVHECALRMKMNVEFEVFNNFFPISFCFIDLNGIRGTAQSCLLAEVQSNFK